MSTLKEIWRILRYFYAGAIIIVVLYIAYDIFITRSERHDAVDHEMFAEAILPYAPQVIVYEEIYTTSLDYIAEPEYKYPEYEYPIIHYIPWDFTGYKEPDFSQTISRNFEAGYVSIIMRCLDNEGWAFVSTSAGEYWVYLSSNRRFIRRRMGLFENIGDVEPAAFLNSKLVDVLDIYEDWLLVDTEYSEKWLYMNFWPCTRHLNVFLNRFGGYHSVYFRNMETGFSYAFNTGRRYFSASTAKAPFALYLYLRAERGEIDLNDYITYTSADFLGGSGVIRNMPIGTDISIRELLRKNISYSDNVATLILRRYYGLDGYRDFVASLGANPNNVGDNVFNSLLNIKEAGIFITAIFEYIESGGRYSEYFRQSMLNNKYPSLTSDYPIAGKSGWTYPSAWHEMAIIYAPSPFVIAILSRYRSGREEDFRAFGEISMKFQAFNTTWFTPAILDL